MGIYKFIKIKSPEGDRIGYFIPRLYQLVWSWHVVRNLGFPYIKDRLTGWTVWWVQNEDDYVQAIKKLNELKKTHELNYMVSL